MLDPALQILVRLDTTKRWTLSSIWLKNDFRAVPAWKIGNGPSTVFVIPEPTLID